MLVKGAPEDHKKTWFTHYVNKVQFLYTTDQYSKELKEKYSELINELI